MHPIVDELTEESSICELCLADTDIEHAKLHIFLIVAHTALDKSKLAVCFKHRARLSFVFDLNDRIKASHSPKCAGG